MESDIEAYFSSRRFAVAGASTRRHKFGNQVFRALLASGRETFPLNPAADQVEGHPAFRSLAELFQPVESLSIVTPPEVTRKLTEEAIAAGVKHLWMQPGAEDAAASRAARQAGLTVIDDGRCILIYLAQMPPLTGPGRR